MSNQPKAQQQAEAYPIKLLGWIAVLKFYGSEPLASKRDFPPARYSHD
jgi:hypothetical protein